MDESFEQPLCGFPQRSVIWVCTIVMKLMGDSGQGAVGSCRWLPALPVVAARGTRVVAEDVRLCGYGRAVRRANSVQRGCGCGLGGDLGAARMRTGGSAARLGGSHGKPRHRRARTSTAISALLAREPLTS